MRVLDFDNTVYDGESVLDFYLFSIKYNPRVLKYFFTVMYHALMYKMGKTTMESLERVIRRHASGYLSSFENIDLVTKAFWDKSMKKLKPWYTPQSDDIIITASFNITMDELFKRLGLTSSVCSVFNRETMQAEYINFSSNKPIKFREKFGDAIIDEFYTDSMFDKPMIEMSKSAYLVKKNSIKKIK